MARVGVIGVGEIGRVHLEALAGLPSIDVVGTFDPAGGTHASLDELVAAGADTLVVATPTPSHADVCRNVVRLARPPRRLLVEKPMAIDMADVDALPREAAEAGCDLAVLYHVAFAPEVAWGRRMCDDVEEAEGGISHVESSFSDLVAPDEEAHAREILVSSWVDVGINALSVLSRFVGIEALTIDEADPDANDYRAALTFSNGTGRLTTAWRGDEKWTTIRFRSGAELHLDHQQVRGRLTGTHDDTDAKFTKPDGVPRLVSHYQPMFEELLVEGWRRFTPADDRALHRLLLEAAVRS